MQNFQGKVILITGAAGGIGATTAKLFAERGGKVVLADRDEAGAQRLAHEIGKNALPVAVDVTDAASVEAMVRAAEEEFGGLDVLVNNAGISNPKAKIEETLEANFDRVFDINIKGIYLCTRYAVPALRRRGGGVILNSASVAALVPRKHSAIYAASKGAVVTFTRALSLELAPTIRVNCVCPGTIDTDFMATVFPDGDDLASFRDRLHSSPGHGVPMERLIQTSDVAEAFAFLASDAASSISGIALPIDGARSAGDAS
ncbi:SDR family NAD(P)-dependent oxidoreductase [Homoserinimonas sp. OAct 916]|uniref:SDR family NAD(P)-dependent oxidoreductase n=1 Tax=Homoserinimonas sp. OAct 916 TaxID=2211450 RepID=UPI001300800A|nr:SDR family oxidoreductase [Homoserinimonas sp. OAct 916]